MRLESEDDREHETSDIHRLSHHEVRSCSAFGKRSESPAKLSGNSRWSCNGQWGPRYWTRVLCVFLCRLPQPSRHFCRVFGRYMEVSVAYSTRRHVLWTLTFAIYFGHGVKVRWTKSILRCFLVHSPVKGVFCRRFLASLTAKLDQYAVCRPKEHQKITYSGRKRIRCLKWQAVLQPNNTWKLASHTTHFIYGGRSCKRLDPRRYDGRNIRKRARLLTWHQVVSGERTFSRLGRELGHILDEVVLLWWIEPRRTYSRADTILNCPNTIREDKARTKRSNVCCSPNRWMGFKEVTTKFCVHWFPEQMKLIKKPFNILHRVAILLTDGHNGSSQMKPADILIWNPQACSTSLTEQLFEFPVFFCLYGNVPCRRAERKSSCCKTCNYTR